MPKRKALVQVLFIHCFIFPVTIYQLQIAKQMLKIWLWTGSYSSYPFATGINRQWMTIQCHKKYQGERAWHWGSTKQAVNGALGTDKALEEFSCAVTPAACIKVSGAQGEERTFFTNRTARAKKQEEELQENEKKFRRSGTRNHEAL